MNTIKKNARFIVLLLLIFVMCLVHSISAGHYADFFPINGTFQNFNPIRRMLSGQIPYRDFQDYLGLGHLYLGSIFTALFGGTYQSSLIAFTFLTIAGLAIISIVISLAVFKTREQAAAATNVLLVIILFQPLIFTNSLSGTDEILEAINYALGTGNSARFIRGAILPIFILLLWLAYNCYKKFSIKNAWLLANKELVAVVGTGFLTGCAFVWSNDYGISVWFCMIFMMLFVSFCRTKSAKKVLLACTFELLSSIVGIFVSAFIFTLGHVSGWFTATFGTGGYQSWYYNSPGKSYYIYDADLSFLMLLQASVCFTYLVMIFKNKGSVESLKRYGILAFANMVCFCAVNEYKLLSGGDAKEFAITTLFITIIMEVVSFIVNSSQSERRHVMAITMSMMLSLCWIISEYKEELLFNRNDDEGVYIDAFGGKVTALNDDLECTAEFLGDSTVWATYASGQELISGKYQPSGTDYIIHVLGDKQREAYMDKFATEDFEYAATIKKSYSDWEYWIERANWFFYRELYANWHPVYSNTYEMYWQKNADGAHSLTDGITLTVEDINDAQKKIVVDTDSSVNGMADVYVDYQVGKNGGKSSLLVFNKMLRVENSGTSYANPEENHDMTYLRASSGEYIPVQIVNGHGEVMLTSEPFKNTTLTLNEASCNQIYTTLADYIEVLSSGLGDGTTILTLPYSESNANLINGATKFAFKNGEYEITNISFEDEYILLEISEEVDFDVKNGNYLLITERENN